MLSGCDLEVEVFRSAAEFIAQDDQPRIGCVLLDVCMPLVDGLELQRRLHATGRRPPIIFMSGHASVPTAVQAMEDGAFSFLEKPFTKTALLEVIQRALVWSNQLAEAERRRLADHARIARLTLREKEIFELVAKGELTKRISHRLRISERTVDKHRERILAKTGAQSWAELTMLCARLGQSTTPPPNPADLEHLA